MREYSKSELIKVYHQCIVLPKFTDFITFTIAKVILMDLSEKYNALMLLRTYKIKEFKLALNKFSKPGQNIISFDEVNKIKEEVDELSMMMDAIFKVYKESISTKAN